MIDRRILYLLSAAAFACSDPGDDDPTTGRDASPSDAPVADAARDAGVGPDAAPEDTGPAGPARFVWLTSSINNLLIGDSTGRVHVVTGDRDFYFPELEGPFVRATMATGNAVLLQPDGALVHVGSGTPSREPQFRSVPAWAERVHLAANNTNTVCATTTANAPLRCWKRGEEIEFPGPVVDVRMANSTLVALMADGRVYRDSTNVPSIPNQLPLPFFPNPPYRHVSVHPEGWVVAAVRQDGQVDLLAGAYDPYILPSGMQLTGFSRFWAHQAFEWQRHQPFLMCGERTDETVECFDLVGRTSEVDGANTQVIPDPLGDLSDVRLGPDGLHLIGVDGFCYITRDGEAECRAREETWFTARTPRTPPPR